jgi:peptide/nickel transport system permease protein
LSRVTEVFLTIPRLSLIIVAVALFGTNIVYSMTITGLTMWPTNARIARAQALSLRNRAFVEAARGLGASSSRVLFVHVMPNGVYPVLANSMLQMSRAIVLEAGLSFLGLGDVNLASWGQVIQAAHLNYYCWWLSVIPGIVIAITALAFSLIGEGAAVVFNPRLREL